MTTYKRFTTEAQSYTKERLNKIFRIYVLIQSIFVFSVNLCVLCASVVNLFIFYHFIFDITSYFIHLENCFKSKHPVANNKKHLRLLLFSFFMIYLK